MAGKKDVARRPKGSQRAEKMSAKLSSWDKEYGDKAVATRRRKTGSGADDFVYYDVESGKWLTGKGPEKQIMRGKNKKRAAQKQGAKNKAKYGKEGPPPSRYYKPPTRE